MPKVYKRTRSGRRLGFAVHEALQLREAVQNAGMKPKDVVERWVELFNAGDADALAALYQDDAVNHQVAESPVEGRLAIRDMFRKGFAAAEMRCIPEVIHEADDVAILEWRDPLGLRGCGFFTIRDRRIAFQRGYWDKLTFLRLQGLPTPTE
jgi:ketosteroid isomerase-like protein